jgi:hypothetical protein
MAAGITVTLYSTPSRAILSPLTQTSPMARIARFVVPGLPHHVTQRGNRRERVFFGDDDYSARLTGDIRRSSMLGSG